MQHFDIICVLWIIFVLQRCETRWQSSSISEWIEASMIVAICQRNIWVQSTMRLRTTRSRWGSHLRDDQASQRLQQVSRTCFLMTQFMSLKMSHKCQPVILTEWHWMLGSFFGKYYPVHENDFLLYLSIRYVVFYTLSCVTEVFSMCLFH